MQSCSTWRLYTRRTTARRTTVPGEAIVRGTLPQTTGASGDPEEIGLSSCFRDVCKLTCPSSPHASNPARNTSSTPLAKSPSLPTLFMLLSPPLRSTKLSPVSCVYRLLLALLVLAFASLCYLGKIKNRLSRRCALCGRHPPGVGLRWFMGRCGTTEAKIEIMEPYFVHHANLIVGFWSL